MARRASIARVQEAEDDAPPPPSTATFVLRLIVSVGSDLGLAAVFLITWIAPYTFGVQTVRHLTFLMLLEFLVVHATGFLGGIGSKDSTRRERAFMAFVLLCLYLCFAAAFSAMYGGWWPLLAFLTLYLGKLPTVVFHPPGHDGQSIVMANWAAMTCLYLFGVFATVMFDVPPLGVTPEVIAAQEFTMEGEWPEQPYRVMAFGTIYFTGMAIVSLLFEIFTRPRKKKTIPRHDKGWLPSPPRQHDEQADATPPSDWLPKPPKPR